MQTIEQSNRDFKNNYREKSTGGGGLRAAYGLLATSLVPGPVSDIALACPECN